MILNRRQMLSSAAAMAASSLISPLFGSQSLPSGAHRDSSGIVMAVIIWRSR